VQQQPLLLLPPCPVVRPRSLEFAIADQLPRQMDSAFNPHDPAARFRLWHDQARMDAQFEFEATAAPQHYSSTVLSQSWNLNGRWSRSSERLRAIASGFFFTMKMGTPTACTFHGIHPAEMDGCSLCDTARRPMSLMQNLAYILTTVTSPLSPPYQ